MAAATAEITVTLALRGSGRTKAMVEGLPATGATVIVHTAALADYVRAMIWDLRGPDVAKACKVLSVGNVWRAMVALEGRPGPFAVDHAFWDYADARTTTWTREYLSIIEARAA
jgi:hypothetical protein